MPFQRTVVEDALIDAALGPASASGEAGEIVNHKLTDLIAADKYLKGLEAVATSGSGWASLRMARVRLPAAIGPRITEI